MNFELSPREQMIFDFFRVKRAASLDEVTEFISKKARKKISRKAITVNIKYMSAKIAQGGWFLQQTSGGVGRGNKSQFQLGRYK